MLTLAHRAMLGAASRPKPAAQLITLAGASTSSDYASETLLDASGNRIVVGGYGSPSAGFVAKLAPDGALLWQRKLSLGGGCYIASGVVNGSGDIFIAGQGGPSGGITSGYVAKYNASGTLQWQRKLTNTVHTPLASIALDASGDVYALGALSSTPATALLVKYSAGGAIQWQRVVSHASNSRLNNASGLSIDSSGNLYFAVEQVTTLGSDSWGLIVKCSSTGVVSQVIARRLDAGANPMWATAVDGSGNIYACGGTGAFNATKPFLAKYNSAGTLQWMRHLSGDTNLTALFVLGMPSDGVHVYAAGNQYLFKFLASDGSLVWQRSLTGPASANAVGRRLHHASGFLYANTLLPSMPSTGTDALTAKLPDDGSGTGTYGSVIVYAESTLTSNVGSPSSATPTITDAAGTHTEAAGDMTDAAGSLTVTPYL